MNGLSVSALCILVFPRVAGVFYVVMYAQDMALAITFEVLSLLVVCLAHALVSPREDIDWSLALLQGVVVGFGFLIATWLIALAVSPMVAENIPDVAVAVASGAVAVGPVEGLLFLFAYWAYKSMSSRR